MITWKPGDIAAPVLLSLLLSACGGGSDTTAKLTPVDQTPDSGAANGGETDSSTAISGRVADGYIRGATVCIDLNDNEACDDDEPSTTSTAGGVYTLVRPAGAEDKSIIADIPAEAIDEDTGKAVGANLLFTAPAGKPEFLSPITTLIQQELKSNPALDVDEAEASVKTILGIDGNAAVSLFRDYVAEAELTGNNSDDSAKYDYLHDTARVIASMMKDIEAQVETAAIDKGIDVDGNPETSRAIRELVRNEVRELLPDIARKVATLISTPVTAEGNGDEPASSPIDADQIAVDLRPTDATDNVDERIQAIRDQGSIVKADMKQLLTDGIYILDLDCYYTQEPELDKTAVLQDQGIAPESSCDAYYDHIHLSPAGDELVNESYQLDPIANTWVALADNSGKGEGENDYSLVNGEWVKLGSNDASGTVKFTDDGAAVVSGEFGTLNVRAVSQVLDGVPLQHHFWESGAQPAWFDLSGADAVFASQSDYYRLSLRQAVAPYLLFNFPSYSSEDECLEYNSNCNVVKAVESDALNAQTTLDGLREATLGTVELVNINPLARLVSLSAERPEDGSLPVKGKVEWQVDLEFDPAPLEKEVGEIDAGSGFEPGNEPTDQVLLDLAIEPVTEPGTEGPGPIDTCVVLEEFPTEGELNEVDPVVSGSADLRCEEKLTGPGELAGRDTLLTSTWHLITVNGVNMLEIEMPLVLRHGEEQSAEESLLLIEHEGFVRLGARFAETSTESQSSYNLSAFETLSAIVKNPSMQKQVSAELQR